MIHIESSAFELLIFVADFKSLLSRTFIECDEVKAVISIGCCYNLLSEDDTTEVDIQCGFPVSKGAKSASFKLGKNARDLACQVAFILTWLPRPNRC